MSEVRTKNAEVRPCSVLQVSGAARWREHPR